MKNALLQRRLNDFGALMHEAWESKKRMTPKITNLKIDEMYEAARKAGAVGGYMLLYCSFERKLRVAEALRRIDAVPSGLAFEFNGLQTWRVNEAPAGNWQAA